MVIKNGSELNQEVKSEQQIINKVLKEEPVKFSDVFF